MEGRGSHRLGVLFSILYALSPSRERGSARVPERFTAPLYLFLAAGLLLTASGCAGLTAEEPPVADSTMVEVLVELHLRDARLAEYHELPPALQDSLYRRYGVTRADYEAALDYYARHPDAYVALYDSVTGHLRRDIETLEP